MKPARALKEILKIIYPMKYLFIIDDDEMYQLILKRNIRKINPDINIISYLNGQEAIDSFKEIIISNQPIPDVVFLDINMPVLDGWQFLEEYEKIRHNINSNVDIYIASSSINEMDMKKALEYSVVKDYVTKPVTSSLLKDILIVA